MITYKINMKQVNKNSNLNIVFLNNNENIIKQLINHTKKISVFNIINFCNHFCREKLLRDFWIDYINKKSRQESTPLVSEYSKYYDEGLQYFNNDTNYLKWTVKAVKFDMIQKFNNENLITLLKAIKDFLQAHMDEEEVNRLYYEYFKFIGFYFIYMNKNTYCIALDAFDFGYIWDLWKGNNFYSITKIENGVIVWTNDYYLPSGKAFTEVVKKMGYSKNNKINLIDSKDSRAVGCIGYCNFI